MHIPETSMLLSGSARCRLAVSDIGGPRTLAEMQAAHFERRRREAMVTSLHATRRRRLFSGLLANGRVLPDTLVASGRGMGTPQGREDRKISSGYAIVAV